MWLLVSRFVLPAMLSGKQSSRQIWGRLGADLGLLSASARQFGRGTVCRRVAVSPSREHDGPATCRHGADRSADRIAHRRNRWLCCHVRVTHVPVLRGLPRP